MWKPALFAIATLVFTVWSLWLIVPEGFGTLLTLLADQPWALQVFVDLTISISFFIGWMVRDARRRGIPAWPYVALCVVAGSIGVLAYMTHRSLRGPTRSPAAVS